MPRPPRKRQQRLAFTPIPSSSPAAKGYHKQIQDRAAAVTLAGSPSSSMRRLRETVDLVSDDDIPIPTPAASLKANGKDDENSSSENGPVRSTRRPRSTRSKRPRQQRLDFNNAREPSSFDSPIRLPSTTRAQVPDKAGMFSSQAQGHLARYSDIESNSGSDTLPSPRKILKAKKSAKKSKQSSKSTKEKERPRRTSRIIAEEESSDDEIVVAGGRQKNTPEQHEDDSGDDSDLPRTQRRQRRNAPMRQPTRSVSVPPIHVDDAGEDDDDSDMPTTQGKQRRQTRRARRNSFISDSPPRAIESDDDLVIVDSRKRARSESDGDAQPEDDDDDELPKTPGRRGLKRQRTKLTRREKEDLEDDLDFLGPSDDEAPSSGRAPRNTQSAQKTAKQQALERLKRARAGQEIPLEDLQEQEEQEGDPTGDEDEDEELPEDDVPAFTSSHQFFQERDEDAEFVEEEEEDGPLGVPAGIPLQFTRYASLKPSELFKFAVDWMLQKNLNPGFQKRDDLYDLTFRKLDDEAQGLAGSKFKSSSWNARFRSALEARPQIDEFELSSEEMEDHEKCDACNRSNHQCTFKIRFHGKPYHSDTLEEIASDDEDSDSADEASQASHADFNANGVEIASTDHFFFVGRFCKGNAATSHALQHWRFHLSEYVHSWLSNKGYFEASELKRRQGWSIKKLGKYSNKVLTGMERDGEVKKLWKMFRSSVDEARESKGGRYRWET